MTSSTPPPRPIAFVDTETTGLDPIRHEVWEIAVIRRDTDGTETEHLWQIPQADWHLRHVAEPKALEINRYYERIAVPRGAEAADMLGDGHTPVPMGYLDMAANLVKALQDTVMIGSNPAFDAAFLHRLIRPNTAPWHYRTIDVATLAAGYQHGLATDPLRSGDFLFPSDYPTLPYSSYGLSRAVGVEPPAKYIAHTALGDARWAKGLFDAVTGGRAR